MDNLCHTLAGLSLAEAGIAPPRRRTLVMAGLAANAPDVDVVAAIGGYGLASLDFRRGITHGILAMLLLPVLIAAVAWATGRRARAREAARGEAPERFVALLLLAAIAVWSHSFLDWLNTYGVRLLAPFDWRWFHGDAVFIIDPWLWGLFGLGFAAARWVRRRRGALAASRRTARRFIAAAALYIVAMLVVERIARRALGSEVGRRGLPGSGGGGARAMVAPRPGLPFTRSVVREIDGRYETGTLALLPRISYDVDTVVPRNDHLPLSRRGAATREGATFLRWSRFPAFVPLDDRTVRIYDLRYSDPDAGGRSWASVDVLVAR